MPKWLQIVLGIIFVIILVSLITIFWQYIEPNLEQSWWQGTAGMVQIFAGIFAIITIIQAKKASKQATETIKLAKETINQADEARKASVRPDLVYLHSLLSPASDYQKRNYTYDLRFKNIGFGPLIRPKVSFVAEDKTHNVGTTPLSDYADNEIQILLHTENQTSYIKGSILIECVSRYNESMQWKFLATLSNGNISAIHIS